MLLSSTELKGDLSIVQAHTLREALLADLQRGRDLQLDASGVTKVDVSGLQLLVSAARSAGDAGAVLRLVRTSDALLAAFRRAGLAFDPADGRVPYL
jgi:anti-anti-sigma factor